MNPVCTQFPNTNPQTGTAPSKQASGAATPQPIADQLLDIRPVFAAGESPCDVIDAAVANLAPAQALVLLVPFEPVPLYTKLGRKGFTHETIQLSDGTWQVKFWLASP